MVERIHEGPVWELRDRGAASQGGATLTQELFITPALDSPTAVVRISGDRAIGQIDGRPALLLLVDDEPNNLRILSSLLVKWGYDIRVALDGPMALDIARQEALDLVLLDIMMPHRDGFEICQALKTEALTPHLPVMFLSAADDLNHKVQAFQVGGVDYITKPFQIEEVLARIETQLTIHHQRRQLEARNQQLQAEVEKRHRAEFETRFLLGTIQAVSEAADFEGALETFLGRVCEATDWCYGEAWMMDRAGEGLRLVRAYLVKGFTGDRAAVRSLRAAAKGLSLRDEHTFYHSAILTGGPTWIADLATFTPASDQCFCERFTLAEAAGLRSITAVPIGTPQATSGVLLLYQPTPLGTRPALVDLVHTAALQLRGVMGRIRSGDEMQAKNRRLQHLSSMDELTQLHNRRHLKTVLARVWGLLTETQQPLSVLLLDVDDFKRYNDYYGHLEGDRCLKIVAAVLRKAVMAQTGLAARYGGEEFAVLLPNARSAAAQQVAQRVQTLLAHEQIPHARSRAGSQVTMSIGIATVIPQGTGDPMRIFALADEALYRAKADGRNCIRVAALLRPLEPVPS
jgi:two-component system cell cycle response regulator